MVEVQTSTRSQSSLQQKNQGTRIKGKGVRDADEKHKRLDWTTEEIGSYRTAEMVSSGPLTLLFWLNGGCLNSTTLQTL